MNALDFSFSTSTSFTSQCPTSYVLSVFHIVIAMLLQHASTNAFFYFATRLFLPRPKENSLVFFPFLWSQKIIAKIEVSSIAYDRRFSVTNKCLASFFSISNFIFDKRHTNGLYLNSLPISAGL